MTEANRLLADPDDRLSHLLIVDRVSDRDFTRVGGGDQSVRDVERRTHGQRIRTEVDRALTDQDQRRADFDLEELQSLGVVITLEGGRGFPLKLESLEQRSRHRDAPRPKWLLLSVHPETDSSPERAQVWVSDEYRAKFLELFEKFLGAETSSGKPRNAPLVANIARIKAAALVDLWQSGGDPPTTGLHWWEVWLQPTDKALELASSFADEGKLQITERALKLDNRHVVWMRARWDDLSALLFSAVPVTELRRPTFVDTIEDLERDEQQEYIGDLAARVIAAGDDSSAVCLLDTGVRRTHVLLEPSLAADDAHSVVGQQTGDVDGHGTAMAGLALLGPLDPLLLGTDSERLLHRLESVKLLPDQLRPDQPRHRHEPEAYGVVTAEAVALPEITKGDRRRAYAMPITSEADQPGEPSLWSATIDALAAGPDVGRTDGVIELLGVPTDSAKRLIVVSAGNVDPPYETAYLEKCDHSPIQDPAQAWNAVIVGASTHLVESSSDPSFTGWSPLAEEGDVSPHSRTSVIAGGDQWPIRPDICMEGGNVLTDGAGDFHACHPVVSLRTTGDDDRAVRSANATSAATAQAARLAARALAIYPDYWPETIRGLLTHQAEWTPRMRKAIDEETGKKKRRQLLKRYGWGIPDDDAVLSSARNAVTMVVQDSFVPFTGHDHAIRQFRLHELPWPAQALGDLGATDVELRVTLSYFIEPSASRRGWRRRYAYASHGLRFELRAPNETTEEFVRHINRATDREEDGDRAASSGTENWLIGPDQRNKGSLHQDVWMGHGAELATSGVVAVHAVGGWWKNNKRKDRQDLPVRYALLVSLRTPAQDIDLYTPVAVEIDVPTEIAVEV